MFSDAQFAVFISSIAQSITKIISNRCVCILVSKSGRCCVCLGNINCISWGNAVRISSVVGSVWNAVIIQKWECRHICVPGGGQFSSRSYITIKNLSSCISVILSGIWSVYNCCNIFIILNFFCNYRENAVDHNNCFARISSRNIVNQLILVFSKVKITSIVSLASTMTGRSTYDNYCIVSTCIYRYTSCFLNGFYGKLVLCFGCKGGLAVFVHDLVSISYSAIFCSCEKTGVFIISFFCAEEGFTVAVEKNIWRTVIICGNADSGWKSCSVRSCRKSSVSNVQFFCSYYSKFNISVSVFREFQP